MIALGSSCKYRLSLAERFDCTETIINQLPAASYQNPISEWQVTIKLHRTEQTGHKQQTSGVTVSHHLQMGPSNCRKTSSGLPLTLHYGELYNYFIIYYNVIIIEIKCTINVMCLNHPETIPHPPSMEKLSSMKLAPGAKRAGEHCCEWSVDLSYLHMAPDSGWAQSNNAFKLLGQVKYSPVHNGE